MSERVWTVVTDTEEFVKRLLKIADELATTGEPFFIACDTESGFDKDAEERGAVTKYPAGNPNNYPFGCSIAIGDNGWWIAKDLHLLKPIMEHPYIIKVWHNAKYDAHMMANLAYIWAQIGIDIFKGPNEDTMLMIHLINEEQYCRMPDGSMKKSKKLKDLAYHFLGEDGHVYEDKIKECKAALEKELGRPVGYDEINERYPQEMADYAIADTVFTYKLYEKFKPEIERQELQEAYARDKRALEAVFHIERKGVMVDVPHLNAMKEEMLKEITDKETELFSIAGAPFNIDSDAELVLCFECKGVEWKWFTDKENYSTKGSILEHIAEHYPEDIQRIANLVIALRKLKKTLSTFVEGMLKFVDKDSRIHADFNVCPNDSSEGGTVTGRLSSSNPNMQNISKKAEELRKCFIAPKDFVLVEMDYKAQEYKLLAHYAKDPKLIHAILNGLDIHSATASQMLHKPIEEITKPERQRFKTVNFALIYGTGAASFAAMLKFKIDADTYNKASFLIRDKNIKPWDATLESCLAAYPDDEKAQEAIEYYFSEEANAAIEEAKKLKEAYFAQFPMVEVFINDVKNVTKQRGYIKTWDGRRRHFRSPKAEAYKAPNALIQGGCGSITKEKLWNCHVFLLDKKSQMVNTVHDSIKFYIHKDELEIIPQLAAILDDNPQFRVPVACDIEWGFNWKDKKAFTTVEDLRRELEF